MPTANQPPSTSDAKIALSLAFPFQLGGTGFPAMADPTKITFYHIAALLLTGKNERVMAPDMGVNIHSYVFDNLTPITMARVSSVVTRAIEQWVPEAKVIKVVPTIEKNDDGMQSTIVLDIMYRVANQSAQMQIPIPVGMTQPTT